MEELWEYSRDLGWYWIGIRYPPYPILVLFYYHYLPRKFLKNDK